MAAPPRASLKPDFQAKRKHFIFTDEHEQLRESIRNFAVKELAPHAEEWEETTFPDSVFTRMGELGFLGLDKPEQYGGQGGDYYTALVLAEEITNAQLRRPGDGRGGAHRHGDAADPRVRHRGAEAGMGRARRSRARRSSASASPSRTPARTWRGSRRAPCETAMST